MTCFVRKQLLALILVTIGLQTAVAQTQAINGSIRGRVTDPSSAPVPKATVNAMNTGTGYSRDAESNDDGYFVLPNLPLGSYTLTVKKEGFDTQRRPGIVLDAGVEAVIDAQLKVGAVSTTVDVEGGAPVLEASRVSTGRTIDQAEVDNLPLTSRNPYNFVIFQPGLSGHPNPELGIPRTLNTNGLLDRINYQMDGMVDTETDRYGLRLFAISDIYVREVQTVSNSFAPEFGMTAGDIFNVITNSGTNQFHGEFYFIGRPPDASARTMLLNYTKPAAPIDLHDYALNSGGPIKKDKVFIFGGYEHLLRGTPTPVTIDPNAAAQIGIPASQLATSPTVQHVQFLDLRVDWNINNKNQIFFRYDYFRNEYPFNTANGGLNALSVGVDFHDRAHIGGIQLLTLFSPTALNELRASEPYRNEHHVADPITGTGAEISISGVANFNGTTASGDRFAEKIPSFSDNFTKIKGSHTIKAGVGWQLNNDNQVGDNGSQYTFPTIASYLAAKNGTTCPLSGITNPELCYSTFSTVLGVPGASYKSYFYDFYVQDTWQVRPNLTVIYGLRWDRFQAPNGEANAPFSYTQHFNTPNRDWAPRLGIAYKVAKNTVVRASSGLFYEAPPTNLWFNALNNDGSTRAFTDTFAPSSANAPLFPNVFSFLPGAALPSIPSITVTSPSFKNAYTINTSVQIEQQIAQNDKVILGYVNTGARDLGYLRDMNLINPTGTLADGRPIYSTAINANTRLFPQFNGITLQDSGASSNYNAMLLTYSHRSAKGYEVDANYTWSHAISDAPDANSFEQSAVLENPLSRAWDLGNTLVNRPQALNLSAVLAPTYNPANSIVKRIVNDNQLTILGNFATGDEQNMTANLNLNNDPAGAASQRPAYVGRDTLRTNGIYQVDMRYTRILFRIKERITPKFIAEANNVFNVHNITVLNTKATVNSQGIITTPATLAPLSTGLEQRLIQLGIRVDW